MLGKVGSGWPCRHPGREVDGTLRLRGNPYFAMALAASLLAAWLTYGHLRRLGATVPVVVAAVDLTRPQRIEPGHVRLVQWPAEAVHPRALSDPLQAVGKVVRAPVPAGAPILASQVVEGGVDGAWAALLEPGEAAVFVPAEPTRALGGALRSGDLVDVVYVGDAGQGEVAVVLLRGARVLDLRDADGRPQEQDRAGYAAGALLAVPAAEVTRVALALERGRVYLALPGPDAVDVPPAGPEDLWRARPQGGG